MKRLVCRTGFFVVAVCSAVFASKPCQALNGGYTVKITVTNGPYKVAVTDKTNQTIAYYTAKLFDGSHEVSALQECGKQIDWNWIKIGTTYVDEASVTHFAGNSSVDLSPSQNTAWVTLPTASAAHAGYFWTTVFAAAASQTSTACHPQGWDQSDSATQYCDDTTSAPLPGGGGVIASVPPLA